MLALSSQNRKISRVQFSKYWEIKLVIISRGKLHSTYLQVLERDFCITGDQHQNHPDQFAFCPTTLRCRRESVRMSRDIGDKQGKELEFSSVLL